MSPKDSASDYRRVIAWIAPAAWLVVLVVGAVTNERSPLSPLLIGGALFLVSFHRGFARTNLLPRACAALLLVITYATVRDARFVSSVGTGGFEIFPAQSILALTFILGLFTLPLGSEYRSLRSLLSTVGALGCLLGGIMLGIALLLDREFLEIPKLVRGLSLTVVELFLLVETTTRAMPYLGHPIRVARTAGALCVLAALSAAAISQLV